jgi:hypothetical protein
VKQCSEGFERPWGWAQDLGTQEGCLTQIAQNRRDESVCQAIDSERGRQNCVALVKRRAEQRAQYPTGPVRGK